MGLGMRCGLRLREVLDIAPEHVVDVATRTLRRWMEYPPERLPKVRDESGWKYVGFPDFRRTWAHCSGRERHGDHISRYGKQSSNPWYNHDESDSGSGTVQKTLPNESVTAEHWRRHRSP